MGGTGATSVVGVTGIRTSLAMRALRGGRWAPAAASGAVVAAVAATTGGGPPWVVAAASATTLATGLATAAARPSRGRPRGRSGRRGRSGPSGRGRRSGRDRGRSGLTGIARAWAAAHPWRFAALPAACLAVGLAALDASAGWPVAGAPLAGLVVLAAPWARTRVRHPAHAPSTHRSPSPGPGVPAARRRVAARAVTPATASAPGTAGITTAPREAAVAGGPPVGSAVGGGAGARRRVLSGTSGGAGGTSGAGQGFPL